MWVTVSVAFKTNSGWHTLKKVTGITLGYGFIQAGWGLGKFGHLEEACRLSDGLGNCKISLEGVLEWICFIIESMCVSKEAFQNGAKRI